jgi:hypothetical protein
MYRMVPLCEAGVGKVGRLGGGCGRESTALIVQSVGVHTREADEKALRLSVLGMHEN